MCVIPSLFMSPNMRLLTFTFIISFGAISALSHDPVISKLDPESRYQYERADDGTVHLVDSWIKASDIAEAARFNPDRTNEYHLFTRANPSLSQPLVRGNTNILAASNFDPKRKTMILIHGWQGSASTYPNGLIVRAYMQAEDVNVIIVDWGAGAAGEYLTSAANAVTSGESVARFINWLNEASGASLSDYHVVGYSLGAHQAGVVGRNLNGNVAYVTGLDPASTWWTQSGHKFRPDDGLYTEVSHTNILRMGYREPLGKVDFYPNGGDNNPGCAINDHLCNHMRPFYFFSESLVTGGFTGIECATYQDAIARRCDLPGRLKMGGTTPKTGSTGIFYLETNAASPFSRG